MTKRELIAALAEIDDDQCLSVLAVDHPGFPDQNVTLIIQGVEIYPPWRPSEGLKDLVGIKVSCCNRDLNISATDEAREKEKWEFVKARLNEWCAAGFPPPEGSGVLSDEGIVVNADAAR